MTPEHAVNLTAIFEKLWTDSGGKPNSIFIDQSRTLFLYGAAAMLEIVQQEMKDAERYRWLRSASNAERAEGLINMNWESDLDAAIDAAMKEQA